MIKIEVPESLATLHLDVINKMEIEMENLNGIKFYDTDAIVALKGISQYQTSATNLIESLKNMSTALKGNWTFKEIIV